MEQDELREKKGEKTDDMTEEKFIKDLYCFMKQRDTPIERIPHLGFKQINLYMMFKAVTEQGGYHQVTAQQLWKKVYNILGGNPRSTSAATCTRRHYEKLLLPYEYHVAGYRDEIPIMMPRQRKRFHSEDEYGQCSKRADFTHLQQYNQFLSPAPIPLPSYLGVPLPSVPPLSSTHHIHPMMSYIPSSPVETGNVKQSVDFLRQLAQEYKSSSGWTEPLNLSKKQSSLAATNNIPSSFTSPGIKKKEPKFLNEAPPLKRGSQSGSPVQAAMNQIPKDESHVVNLASSCSSSPTLWKVAPSSILPSPPPPPPPTPHWPNYPSAVQTKHTTQQNLLVSKSTTSQLTPTPISPTFPFNQYGGMEIKIPLSLFQNLVKEGLIMNTAANQHHLFRSKPSETLSLPEKMNPEANSDEPADLSLKNQVKNINKSDLNKIANERQEAESKDFTMKPLQTYEPRKFPSYPYVFPKSTQRGFQKQQICTKQLPSASVRMLDQPGFKSAGCSKDSSQIGAFNSDMMKEKTFGSPELVQVDTTSSSLVHINPEHLKLLFSNAAFRRESGKIC